MDDNRVSWTTDACHQQGLGRKLRFVPAGWSRGPVRRGKRQGFVLLLVCALLSSGAADSIGQEEPAPAALSVALGEAFTLRERQSAIIIDEGLEVKVVQFYHSPCPEGANCVWSGVGIAFEYYLGQEVRQGIDLVQAFGYQTTILETDHETFAQLKIEKMEPVR